MNEQEVVALMKSSKSEAEWSANLDTVKKSCGGYPDFWYAAIIASGVARKTAASFGASANITVNALSRKPIPHLYGRPISMPFLGKNEKVVGVYDQGLGEKEMTCNSLEEMQRLYDFYASGKALSLEWFIVSISTTVRPI